MQKFSQTAIFLQRKERKKLHAIANAKLVAITQDEFSNLIGTYVVRQTFFFFFRDGKPKKKFWNHSHWKTWLASKFKRISWRVSSKKLSTHTNYTYTTVYYSKVRDICLMKYSSKMLQKGLFQSLEIIPRWNTPCSSLNVIKFFFQISISNDFYLHFWYLVIFPILSWNFLTFISEWPNT